MENLKSKLNVSGNQHENIVKYGELVVLGYNGFLHPADRGRKRSKLVLNRRHAPNAVKCSSHIITCGSNDSETKQTNSQQYYISYVISQNETVLVKCVQDENCDMFQIGRSGESTNDFIVLDTIPGNKRDEVKILKSTVSRFSCRIVADRFNPKLVRIYAGGFDASKCIVMDEKTIKWREDDGFDGLLNNGVLLCHPIGTFYSDDETMGRWRELSVCGRLYFIRHTRSSQQRGDQIVNETNILKDGTLIDLCGATLLWRSAEGLKLSPNKEVIETLIDELNARRPLCPVGLNTLIIPRKLSNLNEKDANKQPYVNMMCGHVQGYHKWGYVKESEMWRCPICLNTGPIAKICMGVEPAFYVNFGPPTYAFIPCGHMASEKTIKFWANVPIPRGINGFDAVCPFCATPLLGSPGYIRLIFQDNVD